jgi:hypothetical protein
VSASTKSRAKKGVDRRQRQRQQRQFKRQYKSFVKLLTQFSFPVLVGIATFYAFELLANDFQVAVRVHTEQAVTGSARSVSGQTTDIIGNARAPEGRRRSTLDASSVFVACVLNSSSIR